MIDSKIIAVVCKENGKKEIYETKNVVTYEGEKYYAQRTAGETPAVDFTSGGLRLGTGTASPTKDSTDVTTYISDSGKSLRSGYPKTNDDDEDNTGAGVNVCTWSYYYYAGQATANGISEGAIVNNTSSPTKALTHFLFSSPFNKGANDTLKIFVNHVSAG